MRRAGFIPMTMAVAAILAAVVAISGTVHAADGDVLAQLSKQTHFHGIAVDRADPERFFLATHHGLFHVTADGRARRISKNHDDFMGFTPHPSDPSVFFASGHPAGGGNLGFIASRDGGKTWKKLSDGVGGPVDFHQMDVSPGDPRIIYGVYGKLQKSTDGGANWTIVGPAPEGLIDLAVAPGNSDTLYAGTQRGLLRSTDGGRSWAPAHPVMRPTTMVHATGDGRLYAFIAGSGLLAAHANTGQWETVSDAFGGTYVLHLAAGSSESRLLYVVTFDPKTREQVVLASRDGGRSWRMPRAK